MNTCTNTCTNLHFTSVFIPYFLAFWQSQNLLPNVHALPRSLPDKLLNDCQFFKLAEVPAIFQNTTASSISPCRATGTVQC